MISHQQVHNCKLNVQKRCMTQKKVSWQRNCSNQGELSVFDFNKTQRQMFDIMSAEWMFFFENL